MRRYFQDVFRYLVLRNVLYRLVAIFVYLYCPCNPVYSKQALYVYNSTVATKRMSALLSNYQAIAWLQVYTINAIQ